jgi:hypothetical protein
MAGHGLARLVLGPALVLVMTGAALASTPYVSPFTTSDYSVGRTDMGVDVCLNAGDPIAAVGDGVVTGVQKDWYANQPFIWYQLTGGPYAGRYVYVAEQITKLAKVGQQLRAGDAIATYAKRGSCIETGWAAANGATLAQATTGYSEGDVTQAGISFARFLISLGVQGKFELTAPKAQAASKHTKKPKKTTTATTTTTSTTTSTTTTSTAKPPQPSQSGGSSGAPPAPSGGAVPKSGGSSSGSSWFGTTPSGGAGWS